MEAITLTTVLESWQQVLEIPARPLNHYYCTTTQTKRALQTACQFNLVDQALWILWLWFTIDRQWFSLIKKITSEAFTEQTDFSGLSFPTKILEIRLMIWSMIGLLLRRLLPHDNI